MVSIVIPAYNCEKIIKNCIESVINQTYADIEIIVIDDGSKDKTYDIVDSYAKKDDRIKLKKIKNSGPGGARNAGLDIATGEYISFVDADDVIYPKYIETMVYTMESTKADLIICNMEMIRSYDEVKTIEVSPKGDSDKESSNKEITNSDIQADNIHKIYENKQQLLDNLYSLMEESWYVNTLWCKLYKSSYIKEQNIRINEDIDMGEDFQFNIKYLDNVEKLVIINDILYQYFVVNSTLTGKYRPNMFDVRKVSIDEFARFVDRYELDKNIIYYLYIKLLYAECMQMVEHKDKQTKKEKIKRIRELLSKEEVVKAKSYMKAEGVTQKVLLLGIKMNNAHVIDCLSKLLSFVRKKCPGIKRVSI